MTWIRHDTDEMIRLGHEAVLRVAGTDENGIGIWLYPTFESAFNDHECILLYTDDNDDAVNRVFDGVYTLLERGANAIDIGALAKRVKGESL